MASSEAAIFVNTESPFEKFSITGNLDIILDNVRCGSYESNFDDAAIYIAEGNFQVSGKTTISADASGKRKTIAGIILGGGWEEKDQREVSYDFDGGIDIDHITYASDRTKDTEVHGIYLNNYSYDPDGNDQSAVRTLTASSINITDITLTAENASSAIANGICSFGTKLINIKDNLTIQNVTAISNSNTESYGVHLLSGENNAPSTLIVSGDTFISEIIAEKNNSYAAGIEVSNNSIAKLNGSTTINNIKAKESYAISAYHGGTILINDSQDLSKHTVIENDLIATDTSKIVANFMTDASHFIGLTKSIENVQTGTINLAFANKSYWAVPEDNHLYGELSLADGGHVYLGTTPLQFNQSTLDTAPVKLTVDELTGNGGTFYLRTDIDGEKTDRVDVKNGTGNHHLMVRSTGTEPTKEEMDSYLVRVEEGDAGFSLANEGGKVDVGVYAYTLGKRPASETSGEEWYLVRAESTPDNPDEPVLTPSAEAVLDFGMGSLNALNLGHLSDLRKRLGEVREQIDDGLWASVGAQKDRLRGLASTNFKQDAYRFAFGIDKRNGNWLIGTNLRATTSDQKTRKANGDAHSEGLNLYATWINQDGWYADFVASADRYHQKFSTNMLDGTKVKGAWHSYAYGFSVEGGRKMLFGDDKLWFAEPQAQLSYYHIKGEDYKLSNGMVVSIGNFNSLTGRLGIAAGRDFVETNGKKVGSLYLRSGVIHEFDGNQKTQVNDVKFKDTLLGTRFYYGFGADWAPSENVKIYGHIERERGEDYTKEFEVSIGAKYMF